MPLGKLTHHPRRGWHTTPGVWYTTQGVVVVVVVYYPWEGCPTTQKRMVYHPGVRSG